MTILHNSVLDELKTTMRDLGDARWQLRQARNLPILNPSEARRVGLSIPDAGPSQPSPGPDHSQSSLQVLELLAPSLVDSAAGAVARVPLQLQARGLTL